MTKKKHEPIAIIGMGLRLPGNVHTPSEFWDRLLSGFDAITDIPADRWDKDAYFHPDWTVRTKINTRRGGFIDNIDVFDPSFFHVAPVEAAYLDPQQRILLEASYHALEDAGLTLEQVSGTRCGVFIGISFPDYYAIQLHPANMANLGPHTNTGTTLSIAANRLSYFFNLKGPSMAVDTACSSSLVALHLAIRSIRAQECDLAIVGGVNSLLQPTAFIGQSKGHFLSSDGYCRSFDADGSGYVRAEGCGVIILQSARIARSERRSIYAFVRGSAINQDGRTIGISMPNTESQIALLKAAHRDAQIDACDVSYIEAHGTGTSAGDPIEARAIGEVIGKSRKAQCLVGSVKSNIGHLEPASGIAGIAKTALSLKYGMIPRNLHFSQPHPDIDFAELNIAVPTSSTPWPQEKTKIAGVSSFGFGGANAHIILEANKEPKKKRRAQSDKLELVILSAHSKESLVAMARKLVVHLERTADPLLDIAATLALHRSQFAHRFSVSVSTKEELCRELSAFADSQLGNFRYTVVNASKKPKVAFLYSGQGGQWFGMARELLQSSNCFQDWMSHIDSLFQPHGLHILDELSKSETHSRINETEFAQPAQFAIQVALTKLLEQYGVHPSAVVGHSIGEVAAAFASGALSLEDAVTVMFHRSRLQARAADQGRMLALATDAITTKSLIEGKETLISIAAINSPKWTILAGDSNTLAELEGVLRQHQIVHHYLHVNVPFHSHLMDPLEEELCKALQSLSGRNTVVDLYSTVTSKKEDGSHLDAAYWFRNIREPVNLMQTLDSMMSDHIDCVVELGPHPVHYVGVVETFCYRQFAPHFVVGTLDRKKNDQRAINDCLAALWGEGIDIKWRKLYDAHYRQVELPSYTWVGKSYWIESPRSILERKGLDRTHPFLVEKSVTLSKPRTASLAIQPDVRIEKYLADHRLHGLIVLPGAAFIESIVHAYRRSFGSNVTLTNAQFHNPIVLKANEEPPSIQLDIAESDGSFHVHSRLDSEMEWILNASGLATSHSVNLKEDAMDSITLSSVKQECTKPTDIDSIYRSLAEGGLEIGPSFRGLSELWEGNKCLLARIRPPEGIQFGIEKFHLHPVLIDSCFQALETFFRVDELRKISLGIFVPRAFKRFFLEPHIDATANTSFFSYAKLVSSEKDSRIVDIRLFDETGRLIAGFDELRLQFLEYTRNALIPAQAKFYEQQWTNSESVAQHAKRPFQSSDVLPRSWIAFVDDKTDVELFEKLFHREELDLLKVYPGKRFERVAGGYRVNPLDPNSFNLLVKEIAPGLGTEYGVLYLWGLNPPNDTWEVCAAIVNFLRAIETRPMPSLKKWVCALKGALKTPFDENYSQASSALLALGRTMLKEYGNCRVIAVDLANETSKEELTSLFYELLQMREQPEVAYRNGQRHVLRYASTKGSQYLSQMQKLKPGVCYLVTGGATGLGLTIAQWLTRNGATHLALASRRGPRNSSDNEAIAQMQLAGAHIELVQCDVADNDAVHQLVEKLQREHSLKGVFHACAIYRDQLLPEITQGSFKEVLSAKSVGAWHLHEATKHLDLDHFVMLSSIANLFGNAGQASYAVANQLLDNLAYTRNAQGLAASIINLGPVGEAGHLASHESLIKSLLRQGFGTLSLIDFEASLEQAVMGRQVQTIHCKVDWHRFAQSYPRAMHEHRFRYNIMNEMADDSTLKYAAPNHLKNELQKEPNKERRQHRVEEEIRKEIKRILGINLVSYNIDKPIQDLGFDSLMGMQLRLFISVNLQIDFPYLQVMTSDSPSDLANRVLAMFDLINHGNDSEAIPAP